MKKRMDIDLDIEEMDIDGSVDHSKDIRDNLSLIKCKKCNTLNVHGSKKCIKCNYSLKNDVKTCPKCAKINSTTNTRCESCNFKFDKKNSIIKSLLISIGIVVILLVATYIKGESLEYELGIRIICGALLLAIVFSTLNHNSKDQIELGVDDKVQKKFRRMEFLGKLFILVGLSIVAFVVYWILLR